MKKIGEIGGCSDWAGIYWTERGYFCGFEDKGDARKYHASLEELTDIYSKKNGVHIVIYGDKDPDVAMKNYMRNEATMVSRKWCDEDAK